MLSVLEASHSLCGRAVSAKYVRNFRPLTDIMKLNGDCCHLPRQPMHRCILEGGVGSEISNSLNEHDLLQNNLS